VGFGYHNHFTFKAPFSYNMAEIRPTGMLPVVKTRRPPKSKPTNPIESALISWLDVFPGEIKQITLLNLDKLLPGVPKRWVVYPPMVLLPSGSFDDEWWRILGTEPVQRDVFWGLILKHISKREGKGTLTHLAINSGIPLYKNPINGSPENVLRTPGGLLMLHGDFGPVLSPDHSPSEEDFKAAFWVTTKQNGITQIWAPRYTMFSRGNIKEKARLLDFHTEGQKIKSRSMIGEDISHRVAVDLYAGIGYFVFSYVKMGIKRVLGWELNPWSVEGLRRGAVANGWSIKVIQSQEEAVVCDEKIVIFLEDNKRAIRRVGELDSRVLSGVLHVNCGLLPSSVDSWQTALNFLTERGWLHLHENVGVKDIDTRKVEIELQFQKWLSELGDDRTVRVEHVEQVKTFAPGVWHCVFDVALAMT
jgi:tRNA wybutosine-synthesizing protein 2